MNHPIRYTVTATSGALSSTAMNLGAAYESVLLEVPTFASGGTHYVMISQDGSTYRRAWHMVAGVATVFQIAPGASQSVMAIPAGARYYKIENTTGTTDTVLTYGLLCYKA